MATPWNRFIYYNDLQYRGETDEYNILLWHNSNRFFAGSYRVSLTIDWKGLTDIGATTLYGKYVYFRKHCWAICNLALEPHSTGDQPLPAPHITCHMPASGTPVRVSIA